MLKRLSFLITLLLLGTQAWAQQPESAPIAFAYDLDSATPIYPKLVGRNSNPFGGPIPGPGRIKTTGSSTSVTEGTAGQNPFTELATGDIIMVRRLDNTVDIRVFTKTDAANGTVDTAVNWDQTGGFAWSWYKASAGTTAADGWIDTSHFQGGFKFVVQYEQGDFATGFQYWAECETEGLDPKPNHVFPGESETCGAGGTLVSNTCQIATAGATTSRMFIVVSPDENSGKCRVGIQRNGADTSDAGAAIERVSIGIVGRSAR